MNQRLTQQEEQQPNSTQTHFIEQIRDDNGTQLKQMMKIVTRTIQVRPEVIERQQWEKWGDVKDLKRGQHREGDMMVETELKMQTVDGRKSDELNFVVPAPKVSFKVDLTYESKYEELIDQPQNQIKNVRQAGESITFGQSASSQNTWLLIVSNVVYFEQATNYDEVMSIMESFRTYIAKVLNLEERRENYFINFLQNKRKSKFNSLTNSDFSTYPLLQKVMLKFPDRSKAESALKSMTGQSYGECVLCIELQEQKPRI